MPLLLLLACSVHECSDVEAFVEPSCTSMKQGCAMATSCCSSSCTLMQTFPCSLIACNHPASAWAAQLCQTNTIKSVYSNCRMNCRSSACSCRKPIGRGTKLHDVSKVMSVKASNSAAQGLVVNSPQDALHLRARESAQPELAT